jgi:hypothetical protein
MAHLRSAVQRIAGSLESDAARESVPPAQAWAWFAAPWVGGLLVAATVVHRPLFFWIVAEDHPLEWAQFVLYAAAAVGAAACIRPLWANDHKVFAALLVLLGVFCLFTAGEEISWGQRIFGFNTPTDLEGVNHQDEFNLHNINEGFDVQKLFNYIQIVAGLVGGALPWLTRWSRPRLRGQFWRRASPALFLTSSFMVVGLYRVARLAMPGSEQRPVPVKFGEWAELCLAFGLFAYVWMLRRSQLHDSGQRPDVAADPPAAGTPA